MSLASNNHLWIKDKAHRKGEGQRLLTLRSSRSWHTRLRRAPVSSLLWDCSLSVSPSKRGVDTCSLSSFFPLGVSYRWLLVFFSIFSCCHYTSLALPFIPFLGEKMFDSFLDFKFKAVLGQYPPLWRGLRVLYGWNRAVSVRRGTFWQVVLKCYLHRCLWLLLWNRGCAAASEIVLDEICWDKRGSCQKCSQEIPPLVSKPHACLFID